MRTRKGRKENSEVEKRVRGRQGKRTRRRKERKVCQRKCIAFLKLK